MDESVNNVHLGTQEPLENDVSYPKQPQNEQPTLSSNVRLLDQFCRLCLRHRSDLVPLHSRVQNKSVPEVFHAITGLELILEDTYPLKMCHSCMAMLDYAFDICKNFAESYQILKRFLFSKAQPLISNLSEYQCGIRATSETLAERMLREYRDLRSQIETVDQHKAATKVNPSVGIPHPQEEPGELPVQIKHEPELILEPDELPYPTVAVEETITNDDEPSAEKFVKMRNVARRNKLDSNKCYICNKVLENTKNVQIHLSEHWDMIPYQCSSCTMETGQELKITTVDLLHRHFRMHVSSIECPKCLYRTTSREVMKRHIRKKHEQSDKMEYVCAQCGKKFQIKRSYHNHVLAHKALDEGRYPCSFCDEKLSNKTNLIKHERLHTGEKPYQCYVCAASFRLCHYLSKHISTFHKKSAQANADGPIRTCKFEGCDFSTTKVGLYYKHKGEHELKFQCTQCSLRFPNRQELRNHQYIHTGVNAFPCTQCSKSYKKKQNLDIHIADHNN